MLAAQILKGILLKNDNLLEKTQRMVITLVLNKCTSCELISTQTRTQTVSVYICDSGPIDKKS